ncbi:DUF1893 domain-containing protein [Chloroflexota bacterium]
MDTRLFSEFLSSRDTLRIYHNGKLIFSSGKERLLPLLEYLQIAPREKGVTVFDRIVGNAAALLLIKLGCREARSPMGSELAVKTLNRAGISYRFARIVPYIQNQSQQGMCPMEKLSQGKGPEEFYQACLSAQAKP